MLRIATSSFCISCHRMRLLIAPSASSSTITPSLKRAENQQTVTSLYDLSVDVPKIRKLKGWVLAESTAYVSQTAHLLRDMGADAAAVSRILETHPEAVRRPPKEVAAQREPWESVCPGRNQLIGIVEKFPASFFTLTQQSNQRTNVRYFQSLRLSRRIISRMMASAPPQLRLPRWSRTRRWSTP